MVDRINEHRDITESMEHEVNSLLSLPPEARLVAARRLSTSPYLTSDARTTVKTTIDDGVEELQFTLNELKGTEAAAEYLQLITQLEDPSTYAPRAVGETLTPQATVAFQNTIVDKLAEVRKSGLKEYRAGYGEYRTYDNVEGVDDNELDTYIADFSTPFTERYPYSPQEEGQVSLAGGSLGFPTDNQTQPTPTPTPTPTPMPTPTLAPEEDIIPPEEDTSQAPSAYTGSDAKQKSDVDFFFGLLKDGEISRKRFMESIKKANVNVQSIDLSMVYKHKGKLVKKGLSEGQKDDIKAISNQIEQLKTRNFDKKTLENKINRQKAKILKINPNHKFKD